VLDSLIVMFRSDALVCASKIDQRNRKRPAICYDITGCGSVPGVGG
jgi:hypothetical protein